MSRGAIIAIIVIAVIAGVLVVLYFIGRHLQKKQDEQRQQIEANKQQVTILVIDKKKMKIRDAGLPPQVYESTPKMLRRSKLPIVKAKIGPQILNLVADEQIFDLIPVKKQVRASISGIYITEVRGVRGQKLESDNPKKKSWLSRTMAKISKAGGADYTPTDRKKKK